MRDIAATIQPEQDDLVRAGLGTTVCVQGAPGTGKTAVGLHRAAYLLYTHPQRVQRGGLLILGPNPTFLSYIAEVLPALGESGVRQSTLAREIARHPVTRTDDARAAALKHDARAAEVLRRALYARVDPGAAGDLTVPDGSYRWRVPAEALARIADGAYAGQGVVVGDGPAVLPGVRSPGISSSVRHARTAGASAREPGGGVHVCVDESRQQGGAAAVDDLAAPGDLAADAGDPRAVDDHGPYAYGLLSVEYLRVGDRGECHGSPPRFLARSHLHT
ncbi:hypothetical protein SVIOM342S_04439 [Streptomyces violaceorubidus]